MSSIHSLQEKKLAKPNFDFSLKLWQDSTEYNQSQHLSTITLGEICKLACHKEQSRTPPDFTAWENTERVYWSVLS